MKTQNSAENRTSAGAIAQVQPAGAVFNKTKPGLTPLATQSGEKVCKRNLPCVFAGHLNPAPNGDADDACGIASGATAWTGKNQRSKHFDYEKIHFKSSPRRTFNRAIFGARPCEGGAQASSEPTCPRRDRKITDRKSVV